MATNSIQTAPLRHACRESPESIFNIVIRLHLSLVDALKVTDAAGMLIVSHFLYSCKGWQHDSFNPDTCQP